MDDRGDGRHNPANRRDIIATGPAGDPWDILAVEVAGDREHNVENRRRLFRQDDQAVNRWGFIWDVVYVVTAPIMAVEGMMRRYVFYRMDGIGFGFDDDDEDDEDDEDDDPVVNEAGPVNAQDHAPVVNEADPDRIHNPANVQGFIHNVITAVTAFLGALGGIMRAVILNCMDRFNLAVNENEAGPVNVGDHDPMANEADPDRIHNPANVQGFIRNVITAVTASLGALGGIMRAVILNCMDRFNLAVNENEAGPVNVGDHDPMANEADPDRIHNPANVQGFIRNVITAVTASLGALGGIMRAVILYCMDRFNLAVNENEAGPVNVEDHDPMVNEADPDRIHNPANGQGFIRNVVTAVTASLGALGGLMRAVILYSMDGFNLVMNANGADPVNVEDHYMDNNSQNVEQEDPELVTPRKRLREEDEEEFRWWDTFSASSSDSNRDFRGIQHVAKKRKTQHLAESSSEKDSERDPLPGSSSKKETEPKRPEKRSREEDEDDNPGGKKKRKRKHLDSKSSQPNRPEKRSREEDEDDNPGGKKKRKRKHLD